MASEKVTDLSAKTTVLATDTYHVVDTADFSQDPAGSSYKITWATLKTAILGFFSGGTGITFSGGVISSDPTATQTLTNKTLTSPTINGGTVSSATISSPTITSATIGVSALTVGSDATGDMYYRSSGGFTRLPIGSTGNLLNISGGVPVWSAAGSLPSASGNINKFLTTTDGSTVSYGAPFDYQVFTTNGTWTKPSNLSGNELVMVHAWGAGGGGGNGAGGGGGGFTLGQFKSGVLGSTVSVTVGTGGTGGSSGTAGGNTTFSTLTAYGAGTSTTGSHSGGGGGALSGGDTSGNGGAPALGSVGSIGGDSSFGGGGGASGTNGGNSAYGGGGGGFSSGGIGGSSLYGGGGGAHPSGTAGTSIFGGNGGLGAAGTAPAGGGGAGNGGNGFNGARGEVRVWTFL